MYTSTSSLLDTYTIKPGHSVVFPDEQTRMDSLSIPNALIQWDAPWKTNPLLGLPQLQMPTYGLDPELANTTTNITTNYHSTIRDLALRVFIVCQEIHTYRTTKSATNVTVIGIGHLGHSITELLGQEEDNFSVQVASRLPVTFIRTPNSLPNCLFTVDIVNALDRAEIIILTISPDNLTIFVHLYATVMVNAHAIIVIAAGMLPITVRRLWGSQGFSTRMDRILVLSSCQDGNTDMDHLSFRRWANQWITSLGPNTTTRPQ